MTALADWPAASFGSFLRSDSSAELYLEHGDGVMTDMHASRWVGVPTLGDLSVVCRVVGPALDIGCGPGRLVRALTSNKIPVLGIDITPDAVRHARSTGAFALNRSIFDPLPGHGRWRTALLIDGNIGIGGDPQALLTRVHQLLCPGGQLIVELDHPRSPFYAGPARLRPRAAPPSNWFAWARVPLGSVNEFAARTGFTVRETWRVQQRWFAALDAATP